MNNKSFTALLEKKAAAAVTEYNMISAGDSVLVGFSGGADSTALLCFLASKAEEYGITVAAAHLHHMTRGADSDADMKFCEELCQRLGVRFFGVKKDVPAIAAELGQGLELAAREIRYKLFEDICRENGFTKTATAHNAGDNAETVLFHLIRGSGLRGLCGIPPVRGNIVRPLIFCTKDEIIGYCRERGCGFVTDKTNFENDYSRNFIRNEIMPLIKKLNPSAEEAFTRASGLLRSENEFLENAAGEAEKLSAPAELAALADPILSRVLAIRYKKTVPSGELSRENILDMMQLIRFGRAGQRLSLPGGAIFFLDRDKVIFTLDRDKCGCEDCSEKRELTLGKNTVCGNKLLFLSEDEKYINELKNIYKLFIYKKVNFDKILGKVYFRTRESGDKYVCGGMTHSVKKMLSAAGVPLSERGKLPFLCDDEGIFWIPGLPERDNVKYCGGRALHMLFVNFQEVTE